ncbi:MAG: prolyl-tRNA synthetase associated domain-containing protein [Acidobacteriota bacterium]
MFNGPVPEEEEKKVFKVLEKLGISFKIHRHPPVFTVEEAARHWSGLEGAHCKNLFLRNKKGNRHYLVILECSKKIDLQKFCRKLGEDRFSFASAGRLQKYLGLEPGAVSPFGLINEKAREVRVIIDEDLKAYSFVNFHPNDNTATVTLSFKDFQKFLDRTGNPVYYYKLS